ncbi:Abi family protein [bacterium]|nr:Abi family protein [bacterium]
MKYIKPPLTFEQQADLLLSRGLIADRSLLISCLSTVNYYRLSGYLYPFRNRSDDLFKPGTTFGLVWRHYCFDRRLRLIVMGAIEKTEIALRTSIIYFFAHANGPFGHVDRKNLQNLSGDGHEEWLKRLNVEANRSKEAFVTHFQRKYGDSQSHLPLWMAAEIMSFGALLTLFNGMNDSLQKIVAAEYRIPDKVFKSWFISLNAVRNICAHHGRLWNRELGYKPLLPSERKYPEWHTPVTISNNRVFVILTILKYMITVISPECLWSERLTELLDEYPEISRSSMGFPVDWNTYPIWK